MFNLFKTKEKQRYEVKEFMHANKDLLVIVCDPKDDSVFVSYKDKVAGGKIVSLKGDKPNLVKNVLKSAGFERHIDDFLISLAEAIGVKKFIHANSLMHFIDGALYNISKKSRKQPNKLGQLPKQEGKPSPYVGDCKQVERD